MKLPGVVKTSSTESEAAMEAGNEVKVESDDEVEPYDGSYACLICTNSVRGQPALVCLQCNCNPWHRECDKEEKYVELCPQCGKKSVQEFTGESFVTAAPSVVVDLTGEGGGGAEAVALTEHGARENATEEQPQLAVGEREAKGGGRSGGTSRTQHGGYVTVLCLSRTEDSARIFSQKTVKRETEPQRFLVQGLPEVAQGREARKSPALHTSCSYSYTRDGARAPGGPDGRGRG